MKPEECLEGWLAAPVAEGWSAGLREAAGVRAAQLELPGARDDAWRLTDLSALYAQKFVPAERPGAIDGIDAWLLPDAYRIVFVDGRFVEQLSELPEGGEVQVSPLGLEDAALHAYFGQSLQEEVFAQLNTRNFEDCAWIHVHGEIGKAIHVLFVATQRDEPCAIHPRALMVLAPNARATVVEEYVGGEGAYFVNGTTEIVLKAGAMLRHVRVQREGMQAVHVGNTSVHLERGANYDSTSLSLGGRLSRHLLQVSHQGEGAQARLDGLILADGRQVLDAHTRIDHYVPNCTSVQRHKCIAGGTSSAVFSGNIVVHRNAKGTDTKQESRNLLLSGRAKIDAQPQLEILNDDVSCKHGATVGQIDAEELFYLKSRGLGETEARQLLIYAFAAEIVDRIPVSSLAQSLRNRIAGRFA